MEALIKQIRDFSAKRDWEQFHSPKNLAMALSVEAAELVEIFQWLTESESYLLSEEKVEHLKEEIGDVMICLTGLADKFGINPLSAAEEKIKLNEIKYPVDKAKGKADKYTDIS